MRPSYAALRGNPPGAPLWGAPKRVKKGSNQVYHAAILFFGCAAVFGIVAETQGRRPPPRGGGRADPPTGADRAISGTFLTQNNQKIDFSGVKKWSKNGPKMANNGQEMAQKGTGGASKIPKNHKKIEKMAENGPTEPRVIALKRVKMH